MPAHPSASPSAPSQRFSLLKGEAIALLGTLGVLIGLNFLLRTAASAAAP